MLLEKLTEYYGLPGTEESAYIVSRLANYSENDEQHLLNEIIGQRSKRFGFPDVASLKKLFDKIPPSKMANGLRAHWNVCGNCHAEYADNLMFCPRCWRNGEECTTHTVRMGYTIPDTVIRYNRPARSPDVNGLSCYECNNAGAQFCDFFGRVNYDCHKRNECKCNACCMAAVVENKEGFKKWKDLKLNVVVRKRCD